ncbi:MAG TPA: hydroxyacid dehydrogenase [Nitrososphaerales archaeon]|nr:hydroxyacid dehydrogenase [Nitrososphaerales archaeon]
MKKVLFADVTFQAANLSEDASYKELTSLADTVFKEPQSESELCELVRGVDAIIVGDFPITPKVLDSAPKLKLVAKCGVGYDNIDVNYATKRGVFTTNVPSVLAGPVAEHAILLMLAVAKKLVTADEFVRSNKWDEFRSLGPGFELSGKTLGIIGFGAIGSRLAEMAKVFHMKVLAFDPFISSERIRACSAEVASMEELLGRSDIVSVNVPLSPATKGLVGEKELRLMKPSAVLINTARGKVLDQKALEKALTSKWIAAAGIDVFENEPPDPKSPLMKLPNITMTPHSAAFTSEATKALWLACIGAVIDVFSGRWPQPPANILNPGVAHR